MRSAALLRPLLPVALLVALPLAGCDSGNDGNDPATDTALGTFTATLDGKAFTAQQAAAGFTDDGEGGQMLVVTGLACVTGTPMACTRSQLLGVGVSGFTRTGRFPIGTEAGHFGVFMDVEGEETFHALADGTKGEIVVTDYTAGKSVAGTFSFTADDPDCVGLAPKCTAVVTNGRFNVALSSTPVLGKTLVERRLTARPAR